MKIYLERYRCRPVSRTSDEHALERPSKIGEHYHIVRKIGEGSFGVIYLGETDLLENKRPVAIKFESRKSNAPQLRDEYRAYRHLNERIEKRLRDGKLDPFLLQGIPKVYYYGQETLFNYIILDYLGKSLEDIFDRCGRKFSVKTTAYLAIQMITRVQAIHREDLIYRDIKPDNFLLGRHDGPDRNTVFVVDFGMAKHYINPQTRQHIPYREKKSLSGTARYMSINTHFGREQSRRDDMEALGNVFMYFLRGSLPWQGLKARDNREKYEKIGQRKQTIKIDELCAEFPPEFASYVAYTRRLGFEEEPDYQKCRDWFQAVYDSQNPEQPLDWDSIDYSVFSARSSIHSHYESPHAHPNHGPLAKKKVQGANGYVSTTRTTNVAPMTSASPHNYVSPLNSRAIDSKGKSFLRRLFCFCKSD